MRCPPVELIGQLAMCVARRQPAMDVSLNRRRFAATALASAGTARSGAKFGESASFGLHGVWPTGRL
jgi:hypothetical protein